MANKFYFFSSSSYICLSILIFNMILKKIRAFRRSKFAIVLVLVLLVAFVLSGDFKNLVYEFIAPQATENATFSDNTLAPAEIASFQLSLELAEKASKIYLKNPEIPTKVIDVLVYIREFGVGPGSYAGGDRFFNREGLLPNKTTLGKQIRYLKWDVNPQIRGENRGAERLVTSGGSAFYTADHYGSFIKIIE